MNPGDQTLIGQLSRMPDLEPPVDLVDNVMGQLPALSRSRWDKLRERVRRPIRIQLTPAYALVAFLALVVLGWGVWQVPKGLDWSSELAQAEYQYVTGRGFLARQESPAAVAHLQQAVELQPHNADYQFWLGVAYWASGDPDREARQYRLALNLNPDLMPARLYLAHNRLDNGDPGRAAQLYRHILQQAPDHGDTLYNLAVALSRRNQLTEATALWERYLGLFPTGARAVQTVKALQGVGVFTHQLVPIGDRVTTVRPLTFQDGSIALTAPAKRSLDRIGTHLQTQPMVRLHVVVFEAGAAGLAKQRARAIKTHLLAQTGGIDPDRIRLSWFDRPYTARHDNHREEYPSMVRLFGVPQNHRAKEL